MSNQKISQLPTVTNAAVGANSLIPLTDSNNTTTEAIELNQLDLRWGSVSSVTAAQATASAAVSNTTGDVVIPTGGGAQTATIQANVVTNAKAAQMAANTIKGNNTGSTANASDLTIAQVSTMLTLAPNAQTTTYTAQASDYYILCSGSAFTVTLPTAVGVGGKQYIIEKTDATAANIITIATTSSQTINGVTSTTLNTQYERVVLISDGSNWHAQRYIPSVWTSYTATTSGLGTLSNQSLFWKRIGDSIMISGTFQPGTGTATEARVSLPNTWTANTSSFSSFGVVNVGVMVAGSATFSSPGAQGVVLVNGANNYVVFGRDTTSTDAFTSMLGNNGFFSVSSPFGILATIPITGWNG